MPDAPPDEVILAFPTMSVIDSCAITNVLSSPVLTEAASRRRRYLMVTGFVVYEFLSRRRAHGNEADERTIRTFRNELGKGQRFTKVELTVDDLREVARLQSVRRVGMGELSCLAIARRLRFGFLTDDGDARKLARREFPDLEVRTTSHLVGWLVFEGELTDGDVVTIIRDNIEVRGKGIGPFIRVCCETAMRLRLQRLTPSVIAVPPPP